MRTDSGQQENLLSPEMELQLFNSTTARTKTQAAAMFKNYVHACQKTCGSSNHLNVIRSDSICIKIP
ncbi:hypothetical protein GN956_G25247 [Arapaima gigas]